MAHARLAEGVLDAAVEGDVDAFTERSCPNDSSLRSSVSAAREHVGEWSDADRAAAAVQAAVHVHAAADVGDRDRVGAGGLDGVELAGEHLARDVGHLDREQAAEAAADLGFGQRTCRAADAREQRLGSPSTPSPRRPWQQA